MLIEAVLCECWLSLSVGCVYVSASCVYVSVG